MKRVMLLMAIALQQSSCAAHRSVQSGSPSGGERAPALPLDARSAGYAGVGRPMLLGLHKPDGFCPRMAIDRHEVIYQVALSSRSDDVGPLHISQLSGSPVLVVAASDFSGRILWANELGPATAAVVADSRAANGTAIAWRTGHEMVLTRISPTGKQLWERRFASTHPKSGEQPNEDVDVNLFNMTALVLDDSGQVAVAGTSDRETKPEIDELLGKHGQRAFFAVFDAQGELTPVHRTWESNDAANLVRTERGGFFVAHQVSDESVAIEAMAPDGVSSWVHLWSGLGVPSMAATPDGGLVTAGTIGSRDVLVEGVNLPRQNPATEAILVVRIRADGRLDFAHRYANDPSIKGSPDGASVTGQTVSNVSVDTLGNTWLAGTFYPTVSFSGFPVPDWAHAYPPFLTVLDGRGNVRSAERLSSDGATGSFANITAARDGSMLMSVGYKRSIELGVERETRTDGFGCAVLRFPKGPR